MASGGGLFRFGFTKNATTHATGTPGKPSPPVSTPTVAAAPPHGKPAAPAAKKTRIDDDDDVKVVESAPVPSAPASASTVTPAKVLHVNFKVRR